MINRKIVAVAAVLLLAVPALAAAGQIVRPGVTEELVEGHTVFAVIENVDFVEEKRQGAAVAVLVRETTQVKEEFKGVLWFNDQYLLNPFKNTNQNVQNRWPCGGAIMAVNEGQPDPRIYLAASAGGAPTDSGGSILPGTPVGDFDLSGVTGLLEDDALPTGGVQEAASFEYLASYHIKDPNDKDWDVDKYNFTYPIAGDATNHTTTPLWVVNILGGSAFQPDDGTASCNPHTDNPKETFSRDPLNYQDHLEQQYDGTLMNQRRCVPDSNPVTCTHRGPGLGSDDNPDGSYVYGLDFRPTSWGYYEPTDPDQNGGRSYCYEGTPAPSPSPTSFPGSGVCGGPTRQYNGLLFFFFGPFDLVTTDTRAHGADDTNGCEQNETYNDGTPKDPTSWVCPDGDDDKEGNSHPFNPRGRYMPSIWNPVTGQKIEGTGEYQDFYADRRECSESAQFNSTEPPCAEDEHAVHDRARVDIYFSGTTRPAEPATRTYDVFDTEGRSAPYHANHY